MTAADPTIAETPADARQQSPAPAAMSRWALPPGSTAALVNHSENQTWRIDGPDGHPVAGLRLHRPGYHSEAAIRSELAWTAALARDAGLRTPRALPARDGDLVQSLPGEDGGPARHAVLFRWLPGSEPEEDGDLSRVFETLGGLSARMHAHARGWRRPDGFVRQTWDHGSMLGGDGIWGRWQDGPGLDAPGLRLLSRAADNIGQALRSFGRAADRFGLVHADIRLANLLVGDDEVCVIDFDDCGFGWFLYDCATALSFIEHRPGAPALVESWLAGYRREAEPPVGAAAMIPSFVMLRRMLLVAWIGSRAETGLAREMGPDFSRGTCDLAEAYLSAAG